jgi:hypothetical protein
MEWIQARIGGGRNHLLKTYIMRKFTTGSKIIGHGLAGRMLTKQCKQH